MTKSGLKRIKTPADFYTAIAGGSADITVDFAKGYVQALCDTDVVGEDALKQYAGAAAGGHARRVAALPDEKLADSIDMAAFEMSAKSAAASDMLSALADALKYERLESFVDQWIRREDGEYPRFRSPGEIEYGIENLSGDGEENEAEGDDVEIDGGAKDVERLDENDSGAAAAATDDETDGQR